MTLTETELFQAYATHNTEVAYSPAALQLALNTGFHKRLKHYLTKDKKKKYYYLVTFTLRNIPEDIESIEEYIVSQANRRALQILEFHWVREYTKAEVPHWHVCIVTTKALKKDRFNYYIQRYGNIDISKNKAQTTDEMLNYMTKTNKINKAQIN